MARREGGDAGLRKEASKDQEEAPEQKLDHTDADEELPDDQASFQTDNS